MAQVAARWIVPLPELVSAQPQTVKAASNNKPMVLFIIIFFTLFLPNNPLRVDFCSRSQDQGPAILFLAPDP